MRIEIVDYCTKRIPEIRRPLDGVLLDQDSEDPDPMHQAITELANEISDKFRISNDEALWYIQNYFESRVKSTEQFRPTKKWWQFWK